jgi:uncharacterized protein YkwD
MLLINIERDRAGLRPVQLDTRLQAAARWFANDIAVNGITNPGNPHEGSDGSTPGERITAQGYIWLAWGETLVFGSGPFDDTPEEAVQDWMDSPIHAAILLGSYQHIGVGHIFIDNEGTPENTWVADFANTEGARSAPPSNCDPGFHQLYFPNVGK